MLILRDLINTHWQAFRSRNFKKCTHLEAKVRKEIKKAKFEWTRKMEQTDIWKAVNCHLWNNSSLPKLVSQCKLVDATVNTIFRLFLLSL